MLLFDFHAIGDRLFSIRKRLGMTQAEVAEAAGLSDRTYADIERGGVNMRVETLLRICQVLHVTPDMILTYDQTPDTINREALLLQLQSCNPKDQDTALRLLTVFLQSLK